MLKYPGLIHKDPDGLWVEFPDFPEISGTQGDDMKDLIMNGEECLAGYLEYLLEEDMEVPEPSVIQGEGIIEIEINPEVAVPVLLKQERKKQGLTQMEVSEKLGMKSYRTIQNVERNKRSPTLKTLSRIAKALGKKLVVGFE